jgi:hypothetical protein
MFQKALLTFGVAATAVAASAAAAAPPFAVNCTLNPQAGYLASQLVGVAAGTTIQITGSCLGNVTVTTAGLAFVNRTGPDAPEPSSDGVTGQLEINGATGITINGLTLAGAATDQPGVVYANLWVHDGGAALVTQTAIQGGQRDGVRASGASSVILDGYDAVTGNGLANIPGANSEITVESGSHVRLGDPNTDGTPVSNPMISPMQITGTIGNGITVRQGGSLAAYNVGINAGNADTGGSQGTALIVTEGGQAHIEYGTIVGGMGVALLGNASLTLYYQSVSGGMTIAGASSLSLFQTFANAAGATVPGPTIEVADSSSLILGGGNDIVNLLTSTVIEIDHGSSLQQRPASFFGLAAAGDAIQGLGLVETQSTIELGAGLVGGVRSLSWVGNVMLQQNSSLRLSGGVWINGSIMLTQGSNGFFNRAAGGTNVVTAGVSCPFATTAASHTAGNAAVVIANGSSTSAVATGTASPGCLGF